MGTNVYNHSARNVRTMEFMEEDVDDSFVQQRIGRMDEKMDPVKALIREARDSDVHPQTLPIICAQDVTGSMDYIPKYMVGEGLPNLVSLLQGKGIKSPAIMFMGIGDSKGRGNGEWDRAPLQVGQFESGDEELDYWLTHTWLEKGGWGNGGESYGWAWWFAANRCVTDHWDKRHEKGFLFTNGDDKCLNIAADEFHRVLGITHEFASKEDLYKAASEKWNVYHLCLSRNASACGDWQKFMGENCIIVEDHKKIPEIIANVILSHKPSFVVKSIDAITGPNGESKITL